MTGNGGGLNLTRQEWITYGALFLLAVVAFGVAGIVLTNPRGPGDAAGPVPASSPVATPAATVTPAPTAAATAQPLKIRLPAEPVLLIVGDSYTAGVGADPPGKGWACLVANSLGYPAKIDGEGGTGFAWGGGPQGNRGREYEVRLREIAADPRFVPNVLILQGGQNDALNTSPDKIQTATAKTIEASRTFWPGVQVIVLGPSAPQPLAEKLQDANNAVRAGAAAAGAPFIDAYRAGWFTAANSPGFDFDGAHPNNAGHAHLAEKFLEAWAGLIR